MLAAEHPEIYPKATVARLLRISRQSLYHHRPAVEPVEPVEPVDGGVVVRGPWPIGDRS